MLFLGHGLIGTSQIHATQRKCHEADSIAMSVFKNMHRANSKRHANGEKADSPVIITTASKMFPISETLHSEQEAFFVYSRSNGEEGFVIVSGDDRLPPVLAYSNDNSFTSDNLPPAVRYWLECYTQEYTVLNNSCNSSTYPEEETTDHATERQGVSPLLNNTMWGQGNPYNLLCPTTNEGGRCVTGCVATAMAQGMAYHQWPLCGQGRISYLSQKNAIMVDFDLSQHPLHWDKMLSTYTQGKYSSEEAYAVAELMAGCGASVFMDYGTDASGAFQHDMLKALVRNFDYDPDGAFLQREMFSTPEWHRILINELEAGRPVNYAGQSQTDFGHSFVIDGYQQGNYIYPYYHLNWGWNGSCDGYYLLTNLLPTDNRGNMAVNSPFSTGQEMLIGVKPDDGISHNGSMIWADNIRVLMARLHPGEATTLNIGKLVNLSYRTFSRPISVILSDSLGNAYRVGETALEQLPFLSETDSISIPVHIPYEMPSGPYSVSLAYTPRQGEGMPSAVYHEKPIQVYILQNSEYGKDTPVLCASEISVHEDNESPDQYSLALYEVYNYSDEPFTGKVQIELFSLSDRSSTVIGEYVETGLIEAKEVRQRAIEFPLSQLLSIQKGNYLLYVSVSDDSGRYQGHIMHFDFQNTSDDPEEYYLEVSADENTVTVGDVVIHRNTAAIEGIGTRRAKGQTFSIGGIVTSPSQKGVFITNGVKKIR